MTAAKQHLTRAIRARESILGPLGRFWSAADLPGATSTRHHLLTELEHGDELLHVRRGLN